MLYVIYERSLNGEEYFWGFLIRIILRKWILMEAYSRLKFFCCIYLGRLHVYSTLCSFEEMILAFFYCWKFVIFWQTRKRFGGEEEKRMKGAKSGIYTKQTRKNYGWIESSACLSAYKYKFNDVPLDQISKSTNWVEEFTFNYEMTKKCLFSFVVIIDKSLFAQ